MFEFLSGKISFSVFIFYRKNYDQIRLTRTQIDKAIYDANQHKVDAIIVVYNDLPKTENSRIL